MLQLNYGRAVTIGLHLRFVASTLAPKGIFWNNLAINLLIKFIDTDNYDINNPFDFHPSAQKAWFYNIFWGVGKNDL